MWLLSLSPICKEILEPHKSSSCPDGSYCGLGLLCFISDLLDALEFFDLLPLTSSYIGQFSFIDSSFEIIRKYFWVLSLWFGNRMKKMILLAFSSPFCRFFWWVQALPTYWLKIKEGGILTKIDKPLLSHRETKAIKGGWHVHSYYTR